MRLGEAMKQKSIISSQSNPQVKMLALLQKKSRARYEQELFVVEGLKMFEEARAMGLLVKAYVSESFYGDMLAKQAGYFDGIEYEILTDSVFKAISDTQTPQGIMGLVRISMHKPEDIISNPDAFLLLLEDIRDPGNLGTIIRAAEGAGISGILTSSSTVDLYNPKVVRSTMGSIFRVPLCQVEDFYGILNEIKKNKIIMYAAHLNGTDYDREKGYTGKCAFLIGNEAGGLSDRAVSFADRLIKIPMAGKVESLNAAVAAAILIYEAARQRRLTN